MPWRFKEALSAILVIACGIIAADFLAVILRFLYGLGVGFIVVLS